jgi:hypothetical protein
MEAGRYADHAQDLPEEIALIDETDNGVKPPLIPNERLNQGRTKSGSFTGSNNAQLGLHPMASDRHKLQLDLMAVARTYWQRLDTNNKTKKPR